MLPLKLKNSYNPHMYEKGEPTISLWELESQQLYYNWEWLH